MKRNTTNRQGGEPLYTTSQTANLLKLHPQTLKNWRAGVSNVELPYVNIGRAVRYRHSDLVRYIEAHTFRRNAEAG